MAYNSLHKLNDNIAAIRIALDPHIPSADELLQLQRYSGFGGIKAILYPAGTKEEWIQQGATKEDLRLYKSIQELHELLKSAFSEAAYKQAVQSLKNSVLTAFYTPPVVPQVLYKVLQEQNISVKNLYEPSAGAGIFISEATSAFHDLKKITAVEKDILTGKVLQALCTALPIQATTHISGLEETPHSENGNSDLVVSNIPFGNFPVHDAKFPDPAISGKIHNYYFAKGLDKLADGGIMAYITTDAFLNSPSNKGVREHLFSNSDFISLVVMPDNLMKDTGNTEAPNHLLIVQKNSTKNVLSHDEQTLLETIEQRNEFGIYHLNLYIEKHPEIICADEIKAGKNQYGNAHLEVWQKDINEIAERLTVTIEQGFSLRFNHKHYQRIQLIDGINNGKELTFLSLPEDKPDTEGVQLGLFDTGPAQNVNRVMAYINEGDQTIIQKQTVRIAALLKTTEKPEHESIVLLTAKEKGRPFYIYRLQSNLGEIITPRNWLTGSGLAKELESISTQLKDYRYDFRFEGEKHFESSFGLSRPTEIFNELRPHYKEGTLVIHNGTAGTIHGLDNENDRAEFKAFSINQKNSSFYQQYVQLRDLYFVLINKENVTGLENKPLREELNAVYQKFQVQHGLLNQSSNRKYILDDSLGFITLSSLERKEGDQYTKADIFSQPLFKNQETFTTDNPTEALAHCLNERGKVDIDFIAKTTGNTEEETIIALTQYIYLNPSSGEWETADQYLSGNVVSKLVVAKQADVNDKQLQRSLEAITKVQPEKIPFELLDFNMGERWMPVDYYQRFASHLFETDTTVNYLSSADSFKVIPNHNNAKVTEEFAVTPKSGKTMYGYVAMEHALENTAPFFTYEVGSGDNKVRKPDNEATQLAHQKIESIRQKFVEWLNELPDNDKKFIEQLYNDTFNCYVLREYNGHHLSFPGLDRNALGIADLYDSQKNAAWRIIQNRGALIDHEVGLGKTLTMVVAAN
ncbi:MAG: DNA methylase, partial [Bacteroidota bacterium]